MANIVLKDVSGNNIYPEIDVSTISGTITENNEKFVIGGDVYSALSSKADKSDIKPQENANWNETDEEDPSFIIGKPTLYSFENYNDEDYRGLQPPYNWNIHTITEDDLTAKQFKLRLPFPVGKATAASNVRLFGDVYGIRGLHNNGGINGTTFLNGYIDSIVITLGDSDGNTITNEPTIRKIVSTEFTKSDRNDGENLNQCRFHFSHFGSASSNFQKITTVASYLLVIVNLPSSTTTKFVAGDQFQILVNWVQF